MVEALRLEAARWDNLADDAETEYADDPDMAEMFREDADAVREVATLLQSGQDLAAARAYHTLATNTREYIIDGAPTFAAWVDVRFPFDVCYPSNA